MRIALSFILIAMTVTPTAAQTRFHDEFKVSPLDQAIWCPCQINTQKSPVLFDEDSNEPGDGFARIVVDLNSLGGNKCRKEELKNNCAGPAGAFGLLSVDDLAAWSDLPESLGPNLIQGVDPGQLFTILSNEEPVKYCTEEIIAQAIAADEDKECIQRQELRLKEEFTHAADQPYWYTIRFRMPAVIEDRKTSTRWILAQWKQEPVSKIYDSFGEDWGQSPFLAQRFDDGVLHVTVQDEHCRCRVASAPLPSGIVEPWNDGTPTDCRSIRPGEEEQVCVPDLVAEYGPRPVLESPMGQWVDMRYRVQASRSTPATVEVWQGERFIVRVTGKIGYESRPEEPSRTKFKIGQYRDYMPYVHAMEIDRVLMEPVAP